MDVDINLSNKVHHLIRCLSIISLCILSLMTSHHAQALEKVSLQLDWKYQFEFAGFIMAKEKGFYENAGLDVDLLEYQAGIDTVEQVLSQKK